MASSFVSLMLILVAVSLSPVMIARLANLAGEYNLTVMIILIVLVWFFVMVVSFNSTIIPLLSSEIPERIIPDNVTASILGITMSIAFPLIIGMRWFARLIASRYAPSVADAIAAIIVGGTVSFVTPVLSMTSIYVFLGNRMDESALVPFIGRVSFIDMIPVFGLFIIITPLIAWILMGWGSMTVLRRRKGTVVGVICVVMSVIFSVVFAVVFSYLKATYLFMAHRLYLDELLLAVGLVSIIYGMLTAGFTSGILASLVPVFDLVSILAVPVLLILRPVIPSISMEPSISDPSPINALGFLGFIVLLSLVQFRSQVIGNRIITLQGLVVLAVPFIMLSIITSAYPRPVVLQVGGLIVMFLILATLLKQWGENVYGTRNNYKAASLLLLLVLLLTPFLFLIFLTSRL